MLAMKLSQEELLAVGIAGHSEQDSDSEEDMPKAPLEGQSQEMQEVSITGGLMSSSSSSSLGSLTKTLGTTMPTAPEESEAAASDAQQLEVQEIDESPKNPVLRSCSSSSRASSGPPEAPAEDPGAPGELVEEDVHFRPSALPPAAAPEAPEKEKRRSDAKVVPPAPAGKQQGTGVAAQPPKAPALEVVGHSSVAARTVPNKSRKSTKSTAVRPARPTEPPRTRKECSCSFCPSCRRRSEEENMRQAIQRSLQAFASDGLETPSAPASGAALPTDGFRPGRGPPGPPEPPEPPATSIQRSNETPRARSSPAVNRNRPKVQALSRGQSIERLRQHTRASIARVSSAGWRAKRNERP